MPRVTANGIDHHVQELGAGPPIVMLHGLLIGSLASWFFTAAPALAEHHRVRMFDFRGHGRSARAATGYDTATLAADLGALTVDLPAFDLVGHSWGALVALRFAIQHPARVRRLVVVEAPVPPSSALEMAAFLDQRPDKILDALPETLRIAVASGRRQAQRLLDSVTYLVRDTSLLADVRAEHELADLGTLRAPTLCAYGDRSACLAGGRQLASAANAKLLVLPGGHYLHLDARAQLTAEIGAHLRG